MSGTTPRRSGPGGGALTCCLRKSLYGLKQSPHAWFGKFSQAVKEFGMQKSKSDYSVFYRNSNSGIISLVVYVDDIVITGSDSEGISYLKSFLHSQFHTKDSSTTRFLLRLKTKNNGNLTRKETN